MALLDPDFRHASHVRLTPDERPNLDDGIISVGWNGGTMHVQYVGLNVVSHESTDAIRSGVRAFANESQLMVALYAGVLGSRNAIRQEIRSNMSGDGSFTISDANSDWPWARVQAEEVLEAFSRDGVFETMYAKTFVVFVYQRWEDSVRPRIAHALGVRVSDVRSDLMGEWRHLRNWLVHPERKTEQSYFENSKILAAALGDLQPGTPEIKARMVFPLIGCLNSLHAIVNPGGLSPALELTAADPEIAKQLEEQSDLGETVRPLWRGFRPPEGE